MKKKFLHTLLSISLGIGILTVSGVPAQAAIEKNPSSSQEIKVDNLYVIAFKSSFPKDYREIIEQAGGTIVKILPEVGGVEVQSEQPSFLEKIKNNPSIEAANKEISFVQHTLVTLPNLQTTTTTNKMKQESFWDGQWDIQKITKEGQSYEIETGGYKDKDGKTIHKAVVGIIDTGIDPNHPDLKNNIIGGRNFVPAGMDASETGDLNDIVDRNGHGTNVAGIIAANGKVKGVGPNLGIRAYRVAFSASAAILPSWVIEAIITAANDDVDVINMSLRYYNTKTMIEGLAETVLWKRAIRYAVQNDVTVVAGSGNESLNLDDKKTVTTFLNTIYEPFGIKVKGPATAVPAQLPGVINVAASTEWSTDELAFYSNYGNSAIDVAAPGGDFGSKYAKTQDPATANPFYMIFNTWPTYLDSYISPYPGYDFTMGTSMATPQVAGIAGVIKAANPEMKPSQITTLIKQTAIDYGKPGQDALFGSGEANAYRALMNIKN